jgi:hypothetical protein
MQRRAIVNSLVAAVAILITGGLAAQAVVRGPSTSGDSELVAAGVDGRSSFAIDPQAATNDTRPTANTQPRPVPLPRLTTTTPQAPVTTVTTVPDAPETTVPPVTVPSIPPPPPDFNWPVPPPPPPPPVVVQTGPASWSFRDEGITLTASVSPVAPRVGETITISFTSGGAGENCCRAIVFVAGGAKMIGHTLRTDAADPCQPSPVTSGTGTVVVSEPGPFSFDVHATRDPAGCAGPFEFTNVSLLATIQVLPALPAA